MIDLERHYLQYLAPGYDRNEVLRDLMTTYGDDVWNFAYFLTRRADAADDISQEVFLIAYSKLYSFRGECSVKSWLLTIARNKSLHYLQSAFIRKVTLWDTVLYRKETSPSAEHIMFERLETKQLWEHVLTLPRKFREVLILDYHYGLPMKEIAELLQVSEGTVKSRLHRARHKLTALLKHETEGEGR
ncbi:RNA polymerase sigma factor [Paenibacillus sp. NPDC056579]|uniref:RNA polymerase sigma factor n=1 Tax=Paenibacillus sp. NPDC056579 TaxID=3345871 RepID=UPI0036AAB5FA